MYNVFVINFGYSIESGNDLLAAVREAERIGFECIITNKKDKNFLMAYSPISGWR